MRCKRCHAELDSLDAVEAVMDEDHRCPHCGGALDPTLQATFEPDERSFWIGVISCCVVAVIGLLLSAFIYYRFAS